MVVIPPKYIINHFFREHTRKADQFSESVTRLIEQYWPRANSKVPKRKRGHATFSKDYENLLLEVGAFGIGKTRITSAISKEDAVTGYVLRPIGLGQGGFESTAPYIEDAAMVMQASASLRNNKATISESPTGIVLTRHMLERLCERQQISEELIIPVLSRQIYELTQSLALTLELQIVKTAAAADNINIVTSVPSMDGLLIMNMRLLIASSEDSVMGWKADLPKRRVQTFYLNEGWLIDPSKRSDVSSEREVCTRIWCCTTYLQYGILRPEQIQYAKDFEDFRNSISSAAIQSALIRCFDPRQTRQLLRGIEIDLDGTQLDQARRLNKLLSTWLQAEPRLPLCTLMPPGVSGAEFREVVRKASISTLP